MKKSLLFIFCISILGFSCSDDDAEMGWDVENRDTVFYADETSGYLNIHLNVNWIATIVGNPDWIQLQFTEGAGNYYYHDDQLKFYMDINETGADRSAIINFIYGDNVRSMEITQKGLTKDGYIPNAKKSYVSRIYNDEEKHIWDFKYDSSGRITQLIYTEVEGTTYTYQYDFTHYSSTRMSVVETLYRDSIYGEKTDWTFDLYEGKIRNGNFSIEYVENGLSDGNFGIDYDYDHDYETDIWTYRIRNMWQHNNYVGNFTDAYNIQYEYSWRDNNLTGISRVAEYYNNRETESFTLIYHDFGYKGVNIDFNWFLMECYTNVFAFLGYYGETSASLLSYSDYQFPYGSESYQYEFDTNGRIKEILITYQGLSWGESRLFVEYEEN